MCTIHFRVVGSITKGEKSYMWIKSGEELYSENCDMHTEKGLGPYINYVDLPKRGSHKIASQCNRCAILCSKVKSKSVDNGRGTKKTLKSQS